MANAGIDQNSRQTLTALSSLGDGSIVALWADPTTHALLVDDGGGGGGGTVTTVTSNNGSITVTTPTTTPDLAVVLSPKTNALVSATTVVNVSSATAPTTGQVLTATDSTHATWQTPTTGTVTSVSGTANRITSTGGATPVIDISASYVGQSSITTLGTITTGVWNGTAIANANLANSSLTIGSTNIALGATSTTLAGLTTVTSTSFVGALTGNSDTVTVANEATDTTCFIGFYTAVSGSLPGKTNTNLAFNSNTGVLTLGQTAAASITGNAGTATALQNARTIGGVSFDGTLNIVPQTIQSINEATDTTTFPLFISASGSQSLQPLNNAGFIYNSNTNALTATTFVGALTGNASTATALATGRTISITGDLAYTSGSFDGTGNVTGAGTLATVNSNVGSFTNASITVNGKGLVTAASNGTGGITWTEVTGTSQTAAINNGYVTNNAGLVTVTLPTTAAVGSIVRVAGSGAGGWRIAQNASGQINFGNQATTSGTGGRLDSVNRYDAVELICITANNIWSVISSQGNITVT